MKTRARTPILLAAALAGALVVVAVAQDAKPGTEEWVAPSRAAKKKNPVEASDASLGRGKALYVAECLSCHGASGKGDGPGVKDLEKKPEDLSLPKTQDQPDGALYWKISEGRKPMPAMGEKWSENQRWDVVNYLRTFKPKTGK